MILAGDVSAATRATLARADTPQSLLALTLGSPEFQTALRHGSGHMAPGVCRQAIELVPRPWA